MKSVLLLFPLLITAIRATGETPLRQAANGSRVRFLGLRTIGNPVVVGMEKNGNENHPPQENSRRGRRLRVRKNRGGREQNPRQAWLEYMARLQKAGYWLMSTTDKDLMDFDGSQWIPGVNPNGQCHLVDRWCGHGIRELCLPLFRLTGMEITGNDIY